MVKYVVESKKKKTESDFDGRMAMLIDGRRSPGAIWIPACFGWRTLIVVGDRSAAAAAAAAAVVAASASRWFFFLPELSLWAECYPGVVVLLVLLLLISDAAPMANKMTAETRTLATLALLTALLTACAALSGFYYDNGVDQTVVHKQLSKREKREMQSEILHLLGLHHRPHPATPAASGLLRPRPSVPQDATASSAPRFLIDVYQSLMEEDSGDLKLKPDLIEREFNVTDGDVHSMDQADIIMSFVNRGNCWWKH